ncbi:hypothetical protein [Erwinia sp. B116]|uniref:hypothetical protein n=1 Tax=Erwinia sp. B116 TaxID=1561024 RepID=UPI0011AF34B9|nr:hypothetical protein [Erwinia sp. B116]
MRPFLLSERRWFLRGACGDRRMSAANGVLFFSQHQEQQGILNPSLVRIVPASRKIFPLNARWHISCK